MKARYRIFRRAKGNYFSFDNHTRRQASLKTSDRKQAERLVNALNESDREPLIRKQVGMIYLQAADPEVARRTWQVVLDTAVELAPPRSKSRWATAIRDKALNPLRRLPLVETRSEDFLHVLAKGTVSTNVYLRRLQNLALDMRWIVEPVLKRRLFPRPQHKKKRAVTDIEHQRILERETNPERRDYYELLWHTGGAQTDIASLNASQIDWKHGILTYRRCKSGLGAQVRIGSALAEVLHRRPSVGPLFPYLCTVREIDRANEFRQRCEGLGIQGITLHSYRYSWAQRAKAAGYPQRYAQQALGHASKAVTEAYAADAQFILPSLEEFEKRTAQAQVISVDFPGQPEAPTTAPKVQSAQA